MAIVSNLLKDHLRTAKPGDLVDVVLEVNETALPQSLPTERRERSAAVERHFASATEAVTQLIQDAGGQVLASSWLGSAIKARIPVESVDRFLSLDGVSMIDLPRRLTRG